LLRLQKILTLTPINAYVQVSGAAFSCRFKAIRNPAAKNNLDVGTIDKALTKKA
jgi:hypothetical protein